MAEPAEIYHFPPTPRRSVRVNSWRWNELEEDALADLPHEAQILYLRVIRKHMDYATGITGEKRRISYAQIQEVLAYKPSPHSGERPVEYSRDQIKRLVQKLVKAGLVERLHNTEKGVAPMIFRLPMACSDVDEPRHESATGTAPRTNPHDRASGEGKRATRAPHKNAEPRHPSGSGNPSSLRSEGKERKAPEPEGKPSSAKPRALDLDRLPAEVSREAVEGFIEHRRLLKKPLTQRALVLNVNEAIRAAERIPELTADQALDETVLAGWQGVKADWLVRRMSTQQRPGGGMNAAERLHAVNQQAIREAVARRQAQPAGVDDLLDNDGGHW